MPSLAISETKIPDKKTIERENVEILGVDKNKNGVRDEVEVYITKYLHKTDPKIYKAYFNYAETLSKQLEFRYDKALLDKLDVQLNHDFLCIRALDGSKASSNDITELRGKVLESYVRIKAWEISAAVKSGVSIQMIEKNEWLKLCR